MFEKGDKIKVKRSDEELTIDRQFLTLGDYGLPTGIWICWKMVNNERVEIHCHASNIELI